MKEQVTSPGSGGSKPAEPTEEERRFGTKTRKESLKVGLHITQRLHSDRIIIAPRRSSLGGSAAGVLPLFSPGFPGTCALKLGFAFGTLLGFQ